MIFKDKIKEFKLFICLIILLATILGVYAQQIALYCSGEYGVHTELALIILTISTIVSILLFITVPISIYIFMKKVTVKKRVFVMYIVADILIAIPTTMFSVFALLMNWG